MLKISVRPELSMNSSSPELRPLRMLMTTWSTTDQSAKRGHQTPCFIWHEVGVLATYES